VPGAARTTTTRRLTSWGRLVTSSAILLAIALGAFVILRVAGDNERRTSFVVVGQPAGLRLDVGAADVDVVGGGRRPTLTVARTERFGFGHRPRLTRVVRDGIVSLRSRCPVALLHRCRAAYRLVVPDNVPLTVRTGSGHVYFRGYRGSAEIETGSGDVALKGVCGFALRVRTASGSVRAETTCAPQQLALRSTSGAILARVPAGRYRVDASTGRGQATIVGLAAVADAPFEIQAFSATGAVRVEGRS